jgi:tRNA(Ile)-lysidine synthase
MPDASDADLTRVVAALTRLTEARDARLLLAVSGGPDSMAMLDLIASSWPGPVHAATVDHGLRPESVDEAAMVADHCANNAIDHALLRPATPITGSVQSAARAARYALLEAHADSIDAAFIVTAHHADDQLETVLMRLARGSGVDGLAGVRARNGRIVRPLLGFRKAELVAHCEGRGIPFVQDPSNANPDYDRVRMRQALQGFDAVDPLIAGRSASALAEASEALDWIAMREAEAVLVRVPAGVRLVQTDYPPALLRRLLLLALARVQSDITVRGPALDRLLQTLQRGGQAMIGDVLCGPAADGQGWHLRPAPPRGASARPDAAE